MKRDYVTINRDTWNADAPVYATFAEEQWLLEDPRWGVWHNHESSLHMLPGDMTGLRAIELGCGTGYVSYWMTKRGASVTGIDISPDQLATARDLAARHDASITFIEGNAEDTGLPGGSFDFAISEYGASIWCEPRAWLSEAHRLLVPGGKLVFLGNHPLSLICAPLSGAPTEWALHRPYKGMWGADWTEVEFEPSGICFNLTFADWMALFPEIGFAVKGYKELYAGPDATGKRGEVPADWAKDYPAEQVWWLEKAI